MFTLCRNLNHGESVYGVIQVPDCHSIKPPMYRSRYSDMVRTDYCCQKSGCYRTMGLPQACLCPPDNYLRKQSRVPISVRPAAVPRVQFASAQPPPPAPCGSNQPCGEPCQENGPGPSDTGATCCTDTVCQVDVIPARARVPRLCCNRQKPTIPSPCQGFAVIERGTKDFVRDNALKVIRQPGKIPKSYYVDHPQGHRYDWTVSGYPRKYVCRQDYGMLPGYLVQRKRELYEADQRSKCEADSANATAQAQCRHLEEDERQAMINGLKTNWEQTYREFQALPLFIDTDALVKRKAGLEAELKGLEKDIQLLERHNHVFVATSNNSFYL